MRRLCGAVLAALAAGSCGSEAPGGPSADDPEPMITVDERSALAALRYDDRAAAARTRATASPTIAAARLFGQRLFFDKALSGPLLEGDNDGSTGTLGRQGEAGKVSCAGCHLPGERLRRRAQPRQADLARGAVDDAPDADAARGRVRAALQLGRRGATRSGGRRSA